MRKVKFFMLTSLDGYFAGPTGEIDWHQVGGEHNEYAAAMLDAADFLLFGRVTYELMANYWPTAEARRDDPIIAKKMNEASKIVFSRTLDKAEWQPTRLIKDHAVEEVTKLKQQTGKDMAILGSNNLAVTLARHGLIDEYQIVVNPVVLGGGKPLFQGLGQRLNLERIDARKFGTGNVLLTYRPVFSP